MRPASRALGAIGLLFFASGLSRADTPAGAFASQLDRIKANPALNELAAMYARDQAARDTLVQIHRGLPKAQQGAFMAAGMRRIEQDIDRPNIIALKQLVSHYGWSDLFASRQEFSYTVVLVDHAVFDLPFQKRALAAMAPLLPTRAWIKPDYALLFDKLARAQHKPQRYGSQIDQCVGGKFAVPDDLEDAAHVDNLRAQMGLGPIKDYVQGFNTAMGGC